MKLAKFYRTTEEELFPPIIEKVRKPHIVRELTAQEAAPFLLSNHHERLALPADDLYDEAELRKELAGAVDELPLRTANILRAHFGLNDGDEQTLSVAGAKYGISVERTRQIVAKGLRVLRQRHRKGSLADFAAAPEQPPEIQVHPRKDMSRFIVGEIVYADFDCLVETLEEVFGKGHVERSADGANKLVARGYEGDARVSEIGRVAALVPRRFVGPLSNDIAVRQETDGTYRLLVSAFDQNVLRQRFRPRKGQPPTGPIAQKYGVKTTAKKLVPLGYSLETTVEADGTIAIVATKPTSKWT